MPATRLPIIGYPLARTALEGVLRTALAEAGSPIEIEQREARPHQLAGALKEVRDGDEFAGALIASPHKEKAPQLSDWLSDDARTSGAVNVLARTEGKLRGYNSDLDGVRAGLTSILPRVKGRWPRNAVVLGAGGGARAVVAVLIGSGFQHVMVFNRHLHRAEGLVSHFTRAARHMELRARPWHDAIIEAELARAEVLINASGIGFEEGESPSPRGADPAGPIRPRPRPQSVLDAVDGGCEGTGWDRRQRAGRLPGLHGGHDEGPDRGRACGRRAAGCPRDRARHSGGGHWRSLATEDHRVMCSARPRVLKMGVE